MNFRLGALILMLAFHISLLASQTSDFDLACGTGNAAVPMPAYLPEHFPRPWDENMAGGSVQTADSRLISFNSVLWQYTALSKAFLLNSSLYSAGVERLDSQAGFYATGANLGSISKTVQHSQLSKQQADSVFSEISGSYKPDITNMLYFGFMPVGFKLQGLYDWANGANAAANSKLSGYTAYWRSSLDGEFDALESANSLYNSHSQSLWQKTWELEHMGAGSGCFVENANTTSAYGAKEGYTRSISLLSQLSAGLAGGTGNLVSQVAAQNKNISLYLAGAPNIPYLADQHVPEAFNALFAPTAAGEKPLLQTLAEADQAAGDSISSIKSEAETTQAAAKEAQKNATAAQAYTDSNSAMLVLEDGGFNGTEGVWQAQMQMQEASKDFALAGEINTESSQWAIKRIYYFSAAENSYNAASKTYAQLAGLARAYVESQRNFTTALLINATALANQYPAVTKLQQERLAQARGMLKNASELLMDANKGGLWDSLQKTKAAQDQSNGAIALLSSSFFVAPETYQQMQEKLGRLAWLAAASDKDNEFGTIVPSAQEKAALFEFNRSITSPFAAPIDLHWAGEQIDLTTRGLEQKFTESYSNLSRQYVDLLQKSPYFPDANAQFATASKWFSGDSINTKTAPGNYYDIARQLDRLSSKVDSGTAQALSKYASDASYATLASPRVYCDQPAQFVTTATITNPTILSYQASQSDELNGNLVRVFLESPISYISSDVVGQEQGVYSIEGAKGGFAVLLSNITPNGRISITLSQNISPLSTLLKSSVAKITETYGQIDKDISLSSTLALALPVFRYPVPTYAETTQVIIDGRSVNSSIILDSGEAYVEAQLPQMQPTTSQLHLSYLFSRPFATSVTNNSIQVSGGNLAMSTDVEIYGAKDDFEKVEVDLPGFATAGAPTPSVESLDGKSEASNAKATCFGNLCTISFSAANVHKGETYLFRVYGAADSAQNFTRNYLDWANLTISALGLSGQYAAKIADAQEAYAAADYPAGIKIASEAVNDAKSAYSDSKTQEEDATLALQQAQRGIESMRESYQEIFNLTNITDTQFLGALSDAQNFADQSNASFSGGDMAQALKSARQSQGSLGRANIRDLENKALLQMQKENGNAIDSDMRLLDTSSQQYYEISMLRSNASALINSGLSSQPEFSVQSIGQIVYAMSQAKALETAAYSSSQTKSAGEIAGWLGLVERAKNATALLATMKPKLSKSKTVSISVDLDKAQSSISKSESKLLHFNTSVAQGNSLALKDEADAQSEAQSVRQVASSLEAESSRIAQMAKSKEEDAIALSSYSLQLAQNKSPEFAAKAQQAYAQAQSAQAHFQQGMLADSILESEASIQSSNDLMLSKPPESQLPYPAMAAGALVVLMVVLAYFFVSKPGKARQAKSTGAPTDQSGQKKLPRKGAK